MDTATLLLASLSEFTRMHPIDPQRNAQQQQAQTDPQPPVDLDGIIVGNAQEDAAREEEAALNVAIMESIQVCNVICTPLSTFGSP
jgi:hypothetical protein